MQPRPFQLDVIDRTLQGFGQHDRQLIVLPTGAGKTLCFAWIAARLQPKRTLILAHREELVTQAIDKVRAATGLEAAREMADSFASLEAPVVVASVQTMMRRADRWPADHFGLVVCDEAHHAVSASWQAVLKRFENDAWILGVTATPDRGDKKSLGKYFQNIPAEVGLFDLMRDNYLCRITVKSVPLQIDLSNVESTAGDFDDAALGEALEPYLAGIADHIADECAFRRTLVFLPLIATSQKFTALLQARGMAAEHVDGYATDRSEILDRFARGEIDTLSNAMLLTEGYDCPRVDCVVILRPTRSRPLFCQMVGRGTRVAPGKSDLLLLDFLWLHERHRLVRPASLAAKSAEEADAITKKLTDAPGGGDLAQAATDTQAEREEKLRAELRAAAKRKARVIDARDLALTVGDHDLADYEPTMDWEKKPITPAQFTVLSRMGVDTDTVTCRGHAARLLDSIIGRTRRHLATPKQLQLCRRLGHPTPELLTAEQASAYIGARVNKPQTMKRNYPF